MSFTDPLSITVNGVAISLPRVDVGRNSATYKSADGATEVSVVHTYGKRNRTTYRLNHNKISTDPLFPSSSKPYSMSVYTVVDRPAGGSGYTVTELTHQVVGLSGLLSANANAMVTRGLGGES